MLLPLFMILGQFHFDFLNLYTRFYSINEEQFAFQLSTLFNKHMNTMLKIGNTQVFTHLSLFLQQIVKFL
jgi:hypothetical protein